MSVHHDGRTHTHVYCPDCKGIQKLIFDDVPGYDPAGKVGYASDIVCSACRFIIATLYKELPNANVFEATEAEAKAKDLAETLMQKDHLTINIQRTRQEPN